MATKSDNYQAAIQSFVTQNWLRPPTAQPGLRCTLKIVQIPGGEVISAAISGKCNGDEATRRSILAAVERGRRTAVSWFRGRVCQEKSTLSLFMTVTENVKKLFFIMFALMAFQTAQAQLEIEIISGNASALPIAIVPFQWQDATAPPANSADRSFPATSTAPACSTRWM